MFDFEALKSIFMEEFADLKQRLFESNGKIFGRNWKDLAADYKKWKQKESPRGSYYPINIFRGDLLKDLQQALVVNFEIKDNEISINLTIDTVNILTTNRYDSSALIAEDVNEAREFIKFSDEEKEILVTKMIDRKGEWLNAN